MKYYKVIKATLMLALITLIILWLYGCGSFT